MLAQEGARAGSKFRLRNLWPSVRRSARRWGVDAVALATVLAVETHARGPVWRAIEHAVARVFLALGLAGRVECMSLGIAQIQPRRVSNPEDLRDRLAALARPQDSVELCAQILGEIRCRFHLQMDSSEWSEDDWGMVAREYGGDGRYGEALISANRILVALEAAGRQELWRS